MESFDESSRRADARRKCRDTRLPVPFREAAHPGPCRSCPQAHPEDVIEKSQSREALKSSAGATSRDSLPKPLQMAAVGGTIAVILTLPDLRRAWFYRRSAPRTTTRDAAADPAGVAARTM